MKPIFKYLLVQAIFLFIVANFSYAYYPQYFMFYKADECFGPNYEYTFGNKSNLTGSWANPVSVKFRGAWIVHCHDIAKPEPQYHILMADGYGSTCYLQFNSFRQITSVSKILDVNLETSAIALISNLSEEPAIVKIYEHEYNFDEPRLFNYLVITGTVEYTLFEGTNFNGTSFCARVNRINSLDDYYGITVGDSRKNFTVGSVRLGKCVSREDSIDSKAYNENEETNV